MVVTAVILADESRILEAGSAHKQVLDELEAKQELRRRMTMSSPGARSSGSET